MNPRKRAASFMLLATAATFGGVTGIEPAGTFTASVAAAHGMGPQAALHLALKQLLSEHATLAAAATGAALGGRNMEFEAAAGALDMNSQDIAKAIGSVYGDAAGEASHHMQMIADPLADAIARQFPEKFPAM